LPFLRHDAARPTEIFVRRIAPSLDFFTHHRGSPSWFY
jgi:hypothetical protein